MSKKAKLIWNFSGTNGLKTAEHHLIHLKEFSHMESIPILKSGIDQINSMTCEAYVVVNMKWVEKLRTKLKPNKGYAVD
jgi:hypothetical protein|tara:strand:+ start:3398 stop:3634 length:237 start_codon:yes stop_codon:yes gene_type:complete